MLARIGLATASLAVIASAQSTTPVGFNTVEGNAGFSNFGPSRRFQTIDTTQTGPAVWNHFSLRRDGTAAASTSNAARTLDYKVTFARPSIAIVSNEMNENLGASPTVVYAMRPTNFPDWTNPPATPPAPFNFTVMLDAPYAYTGGPFLWDIEYANSTVTSLAVMDRHYNAYASAAGTLIAGSVGCTATGRTAAFAHTTAFRNGGAGTGRYGMHLQVTPSNMPSSQQVFLHLDATNAALSVPILCAQVHALPTVSIPLGTSSATGTMPAKHLTFPHNTAFVSASVVTQLLALDPGLSSPFLPLALSNGRTTTMPADPATPGSAASYCWTSLPTTSGTIFWGGCAVAELR